MSLAECEAAIGVGLEAAARAARDGVRLLGSGEMGIGNTTPASALQAHYLAADPALLAGAGTGLDAAGVTRKTETIRRVLEINAAAAARGPLQALAALGGLEIAAICGLCLGGAAHRLAVVVDGFISCAGALAAMRIAPAAKDYLFFAHLSAERGAARLFEAEGLRPILSLNMRLGEGSGAALAMPIIAAGVAVYNEMATFADAGIAAGA
jgi:nicotinate-nucleotide--dimethylbenzimidazole phosphoribosyltransferase